MATVAALVFRHHNDTIVRAVGKWNMRVVVMGHVSGRMRLITGSERDVQPRANASSSQTAQKRREGRRKALERAERRNRNTKKRTQCLKRMQMSV